MIDHVSKDLDEMEQQLRLSLSQPHMGLEFEMGGKKYEFYQPMNKDELIEQHILKEEFIKKARHYFKDQLVNYYSITETPTDDKEEIYQQEYSLREWYHFKFVIGKSQVKSDEIVSNAYLVGEHEIKRNVVDREIGDCPCWFEEKFPGLFDQGGKLGVFVLRECDKKCRD